MRQERNSFEAAIAMAAVKEKPALQLVYADWLEEQGSYRQAASMRLAAHRKAAAERTRKLKLYTRGGKIVVAPRRGAVYFLPYPSRNHCVDAMAWRIATRHGCQVVCGTGKPNWTGAADVHSVHAGGVSHSYVPQVVGTRNGKAVLDVDVLRELANR